MCGDKREGARHCDQEDGNLAPYEATTDGVEFIAIADDVKHFRVVHFANDSKSLPNSTDYLHSWILGWNLLLSEEKTEVSI